ncbi:molybdenum cofactor guanylyltransferase MobA [Candidatus Pantoea edessiphila]|uniref:Molybdenum cofactor guanylyltransferase n=1 Tax=Candidatus Pantoea edessiphila TaxID=2044610 RepID=A0A2P5SVR4_9GAMM|nr:molybdenum cofactor guanylyltransferase MobA [Candidatus Pantoea edessiphila]PPI86427.1 molybdenum cofactor guanylyltransferase [Candidatus Pantoea edessiphila]
MNKLTGIILAGGESLRMGGYDKGLILLHQKPLYQHVLKRLKPQVDYILISANRNIDRYKSSGYKVIKDSYKDILGPLNGILSSLKRIKSDWAVFCPCDTPNIPLNYVKKLFNEKNHSPIVWIQSSKRDHPTMSLIHKSILQSYKKNTKNHNYIFKYDLISFFKKNNGYPILFNNNETSFYNINTPLDLKNYNSTKAI